MSLLALAMSAAVDRPSPATGVPEADVLLDCRLHDAAAGASAATETPYALYLAGSTRLANESEDDAPRSMDTFDPEYLIGHGDGVYSFLRLWPQALRIGFPENSGMGIHGDRLQATNGGGTFYTLRIDRARGTAQVALLQYGRRDDWSRPGPMPINARYYGHCRILEGDSAAATFRNMQ